jgi:hypothetical protein
MLQIKDLLQKFKNLQDPGELRQRIAMTLNEVCGVSAFSGTSFEIRKHVMWLKVHPALKQKVIMRKDMCISTINQRFPDQHIVDIR